MKAHRVGLEPEVPVGPPDRARFDADTAFARAARRRSRRVLLPHSGGVIGGTLVAIVLLMALFAPSLAPHDPFAQDLPSRLKPPAWTRDGSLVHLLGTDPLGRDLLSRLIYGARVSLLVAGLSALIAAAIGTTLGLVSGYFGGIVDDVIMRMVDVQLAFPFLLLAIIIMAVLPPSVGNLIIVLAIAGWTLHARMVRGQTLSLREKEFIQAARAMGAPIARVIFRHLLPNIVPTVIVLTTIQIPQFIIAESALSFLGLGVPPSVPSWGGTMKDGLPYIDLAWWVETFPGFTIMLAVSGMGLLGDWLRDILDPRLRDMRG